MEPDETDILRRLAAAIADQKEIDWNDLGVAPGELDRIVSRSGATGPPDPRASAAHPEDPDRTPPALSDLPSSALAEKLRNFRLISRVAGSFRKHGGIAPRSAPSGETAPGSDPGDDGV